MLGELLQCWAERGQVKIHSSNASILKLLNSLPDGSRDLRLNVFPVACVATGCALLARAAYQENRAVRCRLVLNV